jgi:CxxC motif-containing protein (DUF1111 family)
MFAALTARLLKIAAGIAFEKPEGADMREHSTPKQTRACGTAAASLPVLLLTLLIGTTVRADAPVTFGDPVTGLAPTELVRFVDGRDEFEEEETPEEGLGPVFNAVSCAACHSSPAIGGDSNILETRFGRMDGEKFDPMAYKGGSLIQTDGIDMQDCRGEDVPKEATIVAKRKSTPLFGLGLVDHVPDATLQQLAKNQQRTAPAVAGKVSIVRDAASGQLRVGRFGWKAQVATLLTFSADAYLNEMGITSPIFPTENAPGGDVAVLDRCDRVPGVEDDGSGVAAFADFMTMLAPPPRGSITAAAAKGARVFERIGCAICHVPQLTTGRSAIAALDRVTFAPFSDFLLHDMGALGDGIEQGAASRTEMRTAPLWGLRVRSRFLHDGRASTLQAAIREHAGQASAARAAFDALGKGDAADLIAFLGSL